MEQVIENSAMQSGELTQQGAASVPAHVIHSLGYWESKGRELETQKEAKGEPRIVTSSYDFVIDSIVDLIDNGALALPKFQRKYFWNDNKASRFVESVLIGVPIPSCIFAEGRNSHEIIDGHKRIHSLNRFIKDRFRLKNITKLLKYENHLFSELPHRFQRRFQSHVIRCGVMHLGANPEMKFDVFERLNADATLLTAQEIRNYIFRGKFTNLLGKLASGEKWRSIRQSEGPKYRIQDQELILRFFSFVLQERENYKPPLKQWLNNAALIGQGLNSNEVNELSKIWHATIDKSLVLFDPAECFRRPDDEAFDSVLFDLVAYTANQNDIDTIRSVRSKFREKFSALVESDEFNEFTVKDIDSESNTFGRIKLWNKAMAEIGLR